MLRTDVRGGSAINGLVRRTGVGGVFDRSSLVATTEARGGQGPTRIPHGGDGGSVPVVRDSPME